MKSLSQMTPEEFGRTFGARALRVLCAFLSGSCAVAPAPGVFIPEVESFFMALAAQAAWAQRVAAARRAVQPRRAVKARVTQAQPAIPGGWVNPSPAGVTLASVADAAALAAVVKATAEAKAARAEARAVARRARGTPTRAEAVAQAAAWAAAHPAETLWGAPQAPEPGPKVGLGDNSFWAAQVAALVVRQ